MERSGWNRARPSTLVSGYVRLLGLHCSALTDHEVPVSLKRRMPLYLKDRERREGGGVIRLAPVRFPTFYGEITTRLIFPMKAFGCSRCRNPLTSVLFSVPVLTGAGSAGLCLRSPSSRFNADWPFFFLFFFSLFCCFLSSY